IIDGDHMLHVRISVRANADGTGAELGTTDLMENKATSGNFGPGTDGMTLQQAVFAGLVDPGQLVAVREILNPDGSPMGASANNNLAGDCGTANPSNCDTSLYSLPLIDPASGTPNYTITKNADGSVTVADNAFVAAADLFAKGDGVDTLWNMEQVRFCTGNDPVTKICNAFETFSIDGAIAAIAAATPAATPPGGGTGGTPPPPPRAAPPAGGPTPPPAGGSTPPPAGGSTTPPTPLTVTPPPAAGGSTTTP